LRHRPSQLALEVKLKLGIGREDDFLIAVSMGKAGRLDTELVALVKLTNWLQSHVIQPRKTLIREKYHNKTSLRFDSRFNAIELLIKNTACCQLH
jgi:hypothetical protein